MITIDKAKEIVENNFKNVKPELVYRYDKTYYLFYAPTNNSEEMDYDPYYIVDIHNGKYRVLNPFENFLAFNNAVEKGPIMSFN